MKADPGFYKRRRGILEHLEAGTINLIDLAIHDYLNLKANLLIGSSSSIPPGICITSAAAIHAVCPGQISEKAVQRSLQHLEKIGWIKRWNVRGKHGNYPVLVCRGSVHDLSGKEYRINGADTTDWRYPKWVPVGEASTSREIAVPLLSIHREKRVESKEKKTPAAKTTPPADPHFQIVRQKPASDLPGFTLFWEAYPRKVGKPASRKAWLRSVQADDRWPEVVQAVEKWKLCEQWQEPRFIPHPATFLNERRWEDSPPEGTIKHGQSIARTLEAAKQLLEDGPEGDGAPRGALPAGTNERGVKHLLQGLRTSLTGAS